MGHNWLGILYNKNTAGYTSNSTPSAATSTGGTGGCARCHFTGGWKQTLGKLDINVDTSKSVGDVGYLKGTGNATFTSLTWTDAATALTSAGASNATKKQANSIDCLLCHASNYKPGNIALSSSNYAEYGTGTDTKTIFNAGKRKPVYIGGAFGVTGTEATIATNMFGGVTQAIYEYNGTSWGASFVATTGIYLLPDYSTPALSSISTTPTNEACLRCHDFAGGGDRNKRGMWFRNDKDSNGIQKYDVHAAMSCLDCHKTEKGLDVGTKSSHKISLGMGDLWARDVKIGQANYQDRGKHSSECSNSDCHGNRPHSNKLLNDHYANVGTTSIGDGIPSGKVDCRTCHIPYQYGQKSKDFQNLKAFDTSTGLFDSKVVNRTATSANNKDYTIVGSLERPKYQWFNGLHSGHGAAAVAAPFTDTNAKITPFTVYSIRNITDASGKKIPLKFGVLAQTGNILMAASNKPGNADGTAFVPDQNSVESNMLYTAYDKSVLGATYEIDNDYLRGISSATFNENNFIIGHRVQPKSRALNCIDCHTSKTFFTDLGYSSNAGGEAEILSTVYGQ